MINALAVFSLLCIPLAFLGGGWAMFGRDPRRLVFLPRTLGICLGLNLMSLLWTTYRLLQLAAPDGFLFSPTMMDDPAYVAGEVNLIIIAPMPAALATWLLSLSLVFTFGRMKSSLHALSMLVWIYPAYKVITAAMAVVDQLALVAQAETEVSATEAQSNMLSTLSELSDSLLWAGGIAVALFLLLQALAWQPKHLVSKRVA